MGEERQALLLHSVSKVINQGSSEEPEDGFYQIQTDNNEEFLVPEEVQTFIQFHF